MRLLNNWTQLYKLVTAVDFCTGFQNKNSPLHKNYHQDSISKCKMSKFVLDNLPSKE